MKTLKENIRASVRESMRETKLRELARYLRVKTEDAFLAGDAQNALNWSERLDRVVYELMLIKNRDVLAHRYATKAS